MLRILKQRDSNNEVPADFANFVNMWSLEAITAISVNKRLGLFGTEVKNEKPKELITLARRFFELSYEFEIQPKIWKVYATKSFKELMSILDGISK